MGERTIRHFFAGALRPGAASSYGSWGHSPCSRARECGTPKSNPRPMSIESQELIPDRQSLPIRKITRVGTLSSQVEARLEKLIIENRIPPGGSLPTERDLSERFQVSRTVIREAVRGLVAKGLLEVNMGSGTIVRRPSTQLVSQTMSLYLRGDRQEVDHESVTEVRRLLEIEIAGRAAERRTEKDLTELKTVLDDYGNVAEDRQSYVKWDLDFHLRLAAATHNELFVLLLNSIGGIMTKVREIGFRVPGSRERALRHHTAIFKQVELGSPDGARQAMREHIEDSENVMKTAMGLAPAEPQPGKGQP